MNNLGKNFHKSKSHFDSDALLKLTNVYFVVAGNEAQSSFTHF